MRNRLVAIAAGGMLSLLLVSPAAAQLCAGQPTVPGQTSVGLRAAFPTGGTQIGVEASRNWMNPLAAFANLNLLLPDAEGADNVPLIGVGFAYEVAEFIPAIPAWLSVCPMAGATVEMGSDATGFTIPLGVGFTTRIGTPEGFSINPFVIPQFQFVRLAIDNVDVTNQFGIGFGAMLRFGGVYGGATLGRAFVDDATTDIVFHGGLTFPVIRR